MINVVNAVQRITSRKNPMCVHLRSLATSKGYRDECGEFICDGRKLLEEAVACGTEIKAVMTSSGIPFPMPVDTRVFFAQRGLIDSLSPLKNAQDTLFACAKPKKKDFIYASGTHILLDNVQDPGNVGTILRTANAFGIKSVILTAGCADPYNPKTIRASMGAIFRQDIYSMDFSELTELRNKGFRFIGAALREDCSDVSAVSFDDSIISIGSEGSGLSEEILALCDEKVRIPVAPECDSLNAAVAAAIIIWEAARCLH